MQQAASELTSSLDLAGQVLSDLSIALTGLKHVASEAIAHNSAESEGSDTATWSLACWAEDRVNLLEQVLEDVRRAADGEKANG